MEKWKHSIILITLTVIVYILTRYPVIGHYRLFLAIGCGLFTLGYFLFLKYKKKKKFITMDEDFPLVLQYLCYTTLLFFIGATGWVLSPLFFLLYVVGILLGITKDMKQQIVYLIALMILFSLRIGEIDVAYDILIVLSFLTTIPVTLILQKYLLVYYGEKLHRRIK